MFWHFLITFLTNFVAGWRSYSTCSNSYKRASNVNRNRVFDVRLKVPNLDTQHLRGSPQRRSNRRSRGRRWDFNCYARPANWLLGYKRDECPESDIPGPRWGRPNAGNVLTFLPTWVTTVIDNFYHFFRSCYRTWASNSNYRESWGTFGQIVKLSCSAQLGLRKLKHFPRHTAAESKNLSESRSAYKKRQQTQQLGSKFSQWLRKKNTFALLSFSPSCNQREANHVSLSSVKPKKVSTTS